MLVLSHRDRLYSSTLPFVQRRLSFATFTFMVTDHPSCRVYGSAARRVTRESWPLQSTVVQSMPLKEITLCMHPSALPVCKRHRRRREFAVVQPPRKDNIERQPSSALAFSRKVDHHRVVVLIVRHPLGTYLFGTSFQSLFWHGDHCTVVVQAPHRAQSAFALAFAINHSGAGPR